MHWSGRHMILVGVLCVAGLISVRESHRQVTLGYEIARTETNLRRLRQEQDSEYAQYQSLQVPSKVIQRNTDLKLGMAPESPLSVYTPPRPPKNSGQ